MDIGKAAQKARKIYFKKSQNRSEIHRKIELAREMRTPFTVGERTGDTYYHIVRLERGSIFRKSTKTRYVYWDAEKEILVNTYLDVGTGLSEESFRQWEVAYIEREACDG